MRTHQGMGPIGRTTRLVAAAGLLYLALFNGTSWGLSWYGALLGILVLPGGMLALALAAARRRARVVSSATR